MDSVFLIHPVHYGHVCLSFSSQFSCTMGVMHVSLRSYEQPILFILLFTLPFLLFFFVRLSFHKYEGRATSSQLGSQLFFTFSIFLVFYAVTLLHSSSYRFVYGNFVFSSSFISSETAIDVPLVHARCSIHSLILHALPAVCTPEGLLCLGEAQQQPQPRRLRLLFYVDRSIFLHIYLSMYQSLVHERAKQEKK